MLVLLAAVLVAVAIVIGAAFWSRLPRRKQPDGGGAAERVGVAPTVPEPGDSDGAPAEGGAAEAAVAEDPNAIRPLTSHEVFTRMCEFALGRGRGTELAAGHEGIAEASAAALLDAATQQRYAPRRPNMLPRLLSAANDENVSRRELTSIIARDPSLVGNLLKIANSSFYRITPEPVESVDRAVALLGTDGIRSLITAAVMQPIFRFGGADFPRFPEVAWEHTFRSASAAVPYTFFVEKADPFTAELLSLVMGLAGIVVFRVAMDQYAASPRLVPHASVIAWLLDNHCAATARRI
ncbi:MAG TPA: HDOD domain-containing protein, partial [Steroidobacteraceae bacterium]|nr:HDOD domain-containing protein [Steroidobacteraceae bacterium]